MKIDLHCHTKATKKGDSIKREVTLEKFKEKIISTDVKIIGITNHNHFDKKQYEEFSVALKDACMIWPGIELDVQGINDDKGHVVIVANPENLNDFDKAVNKIIKGVNPNDFMCTTDELINFTNTVDCIVMPHFFKPKSLDEESITYIRNKITDNYRLLYEPANYRSLGVLINHNKKSIVGSDVDDWDLYHTYEFANLKINVDSYEQFMFLVKKDTSLIETLLQKHNKTEIDISYSGNKEEKVDFYDNINVFFGSKGTGKTESLKKTKNHFIEKGKNVGFYEPNETQDRIDEKLIVNKEERKLANYGLDNLADQFNEISNWADENITQFKDFINYISSKNKNKNKEKMKILEVTNIANEFDELLENSKTELTSFKKSTDELNKINISKYINEEEQKVFNTILSKLGNSIFNTRNENWENKSSIDLSNYTIETIKEIIERNTELKTKPSTTGFRNFAHNRLRLKKSLCDICDAFSYKIDDQVEFVGELEEGKKLEKRTIRKMVDNNSKTDEFKHGIQKLRDIKNTFFEIYEKIWTLDIYSDIDTLKEKLDKEDISSMDAFLGIIKQFEINGEFYRPSTGEATMIILNEILNNDYDVYILDEPEKSLGNSYVNDVLVPRINELSKLNKCVIIVTHNANIAVRTFPFRSVLKEYINCEYKTYIGNPFTNKLINISDEKDMKDWKAESIKILEGGKEAFTERGEIYGE